jgi:hypothetical protein
MTDHFQLDVQSQRRLVYTATTVEEREHYMNELRRFEALAELSRTDLAAARRAYRPARAYEGN